MIEKVVLVEDEKPAAKHLEQLLTGLGIAVIAQLDSVKNTAKWLANNEPPELLLMDIQLGDGLSFEVFDIVKVNCPIIFITAFNEYAIEAFKVNSIAYLLKPLQKEALIEALKKYDSMQLAFNTEIESEKIQRARHQIKNEYKSRFILKVGAHLKSIAIEDILYFFSQDKATFIKTKDARSYVVENTLEQIQSLVDPHDFYRIGRKYLVHFDSIEDIVSFTNSRLLLKLTHLKERDAIVSREKVNDFKQWLDR